VVSDPQHVVNSPKIIFIGVESKTFHWKIEISPSRYPFTAPTVYNLDKIAHEEIEEETGKMLVPCLTSNWSPVLTLKTIVYVLKLFIIGTLEDYEPQEILYQGEFGRRADGFGGSEGDGRRVQAGVRGEKYFWERPCYDFVFDRRCLDLNS